MLHPQDDSTPLASRVSRRQALKTASAGFGYLALAGMLGQNAAKSSAAEKNRPNPLAPLLPKPAHFAVKAKRIIFLFMEGATSQMDTWEYKRAVQENDGK